MVILLYRHIFQLKLGQNTIVSNIRENCVLTPFILVGFSNLASIVRAEYMGTDPFSLLTQIIDPISEKRGLSPIITAIFLLSI